MRMCARVCSITRTSKRVSGMDVVIARENEKDLYAGISGTGRPMRLTNVEAHQPSGIGKNCRYAFEMRAGSNRKSVTASARQHHEIHRRPVS